MHELSEHGWITGRVLLDGEDIYAPRVNAMQLRRRVGMVFQRPTPFPTMSVYDNVAAGLRVDGRLPRQQLDGIVERSLRQAALWDEVKDRLQGQRDGAVGRAAAAALHRPDHRAVARRDPAGRADGFARPPGDPADRGAAVRAEAGFTIIIVTHNMQQAARVSDTTTFFYLGSMIETGPTRQIFTAPRNEQTEAYITGRFG